MKEHKLQYMYARNADASLIIPTSRECYKKENGGQLKRGEKENPKQSDFG